MVIVSTYIIAQCWRKVGMEVKNEFNRPWRPLYCWLMSTRLARNDDHEVLSWSDRVLKNVGK
jgi:hypothetical protein